MNRQQIIAAVDNPQTLNSSSLDQLKVILDEYPFFQAGRMLWVKNLHLLDHIRYNNELKLAAAHIADRSRLFELINLPDCGIHKGLDKKSELAEEIKNRDSVGSKGRIELEQRVGQESGYMRDNEPDNSELKSAFPEDADNIVLPSADLLGYEFDASSAYQLTDHDELSLDEARSFSGWLNVLRSRPPASEPQKQTEAQTDKQHAKKVSLIDNFLEGGMRRRIITAAEGKVENVDISAKSLEESDDLITETLANIYIKQKHFSKALDIFERLRLKYPEKSVYFARRIKDLVENSNM